MIVATKLHVAAEIGFWRMPQVLELAAVLDISRREAGALVLELRELVLTHGEGSGLLPRWNKQRLALALDWPVRRFEKLFRALKSAGFIVAERGARGLKYPFWPETITGYYQDRRQGDAERKAAERAAITEAKRLALLNSTNLVHGRSTDSPRISLDQASKQASVDPPVPPKGGDSFGFAEWFETYPTPEKPTETLALWVALTDAERDQCRGDLPYCLKTNKRFVTKSPIYLANKKFLRFKPGSLPAKPPTKQELDAEKAAQKVEDERMAKTWTDGDKSSEPPRETKPAGDEPSPTLSV